MTNPPIPDFPDERLAIRLFNAIDVQDGSEDDDGPPWRCTDVGTEVSVDFSEFDVEDRIEILEPSPSRAAELRAGAALTDDETSALRAAIEEAHSENRLHVVLYTTVDAAGNEWTFVRKVGDGGSTVSIDGPYPSSEDPLAHLRDEPEHSFREEDSWASCEIGEWLGNSESKSMASSQVSTGNLNVGKAQRGNPK